MHILTWWWNASIMMTIEGDENMNKALIIKSNWIITAPCHADKDNQRVRPWLKSFKKADELLPNAEVRKSLQATCQDLAARFCLCLHFFIKAVDPTPFPGLCSLSPKQSMSICPFPFHSLSCFAVAEPRHVTQGWLTAVCWFTATAYFLCLFVLMSAFSGISGWVRAPLFQGPLLTSGNRHRKGVGLFFFFPWMSGPFQRNPLGQLPAWVHHPGDHNHSFHGC